MSNIPSNLVNELMSLADKFEEYYRQDERQKILSQIADKEQPVSYTHLTLPTKA